MPCIRIFIFPSLFASLSFLRHPLHCARHSVTAIAIFIASLSDEAQIVASRFPQQAFLCFDTGALPTMFKQVCVCVCGLGKTIMAMIAVYTVLPHAL